MKVIKAAVIFLYFVNIDGAVYKTSLAERLKQVISMTNGRPAILVIIPSNTASDNIWSKKLRIEGAHKKKSGKGGIAADYYDFDVGRSFAKNDYDTGFHILRQRSCKDLNRDCIIMQSLIWDRYCLADKYCQKENNIDRCAEICPDECSKMVLCNKTSKQPMTF